MEKPNSAMVRLDEEAKARLAGAQTQTIAMTAAEQLQFWQALAKPPKLSKAQQRLAAVMRGKA